MYMNVNVMKLSICVFAGLCNSVKYSSFFQAANSRLGPGECIVFTQPGVKDE